MAFRFRADGGNVSSGWYVDDVQVVSDPYLLPNPESFEGGFVYSSALRGVWQVGELPASRGSAHSGSQVGSEERREGKAGRSGWWPNH